MKFLKEIINDFLYLWNLKYSDKNCKDNDKCNRIFLLITIIALGFLLFIAYISKENFIVFKIFLYYSIILLILLLTINISFIIKNCKRDRFKSFEFSISDFLWKILVVFLIPSIFLFEIMGINIRITNDEKNSLIPVETLYASLNSIIIVYIYNYIFLSIQKKLNDVIINKDFIINFSALSLILSFLIVKFIIEIINFHFINKIIAWIYTKMIKEINIDLESVKNDIKSRLEKLLYKLELSLLILTYFMVVISPLDYESLNSDIMNSITVITLLILFYDKNKEWK